MPQRVVQMTAAEAWGIIQDQIADDCGPFDEGWQSEELREAVETFHRLYSPHLTKKALFPNDPFYWPKSDRVKRKKVGHGRH